MTHSHNQKGTLRPDVVASTKIPFPPPFPFGEGSAPTGPQGPRGSRHWGFQPHSVCPSGKATCLCTRQWQAPYSPVRCSACGLRSAAASVRGRGLAPTIDPFQVKRRHSQRRTTRLHRRFIDAHQRVDEWTAHLALGRCALTYQALKGVFQCPQRLDALSYIGQLVLADAACC